MIWIGWIAAGLVVFGLVEMVYLSLVLRWEDRFTVGNGYYGRPPAERQRYRRRLRLHARLLFPITHLLGRFSTFRFDRVSFQHRGIAGPRGTCSPESFARADRWQAGPADLFVATQMKCGTTWMLHLAYQVLRRGEGDLVESGSTLHAVCPWIEGRKTVSMEAAPLVGVERPWRIIKTHLPATHCPYSAEARYIYVVRHPISCFASCADFLASNTGSFAPSLEQIEAWFLSRELMWWGPWTSHVAGWWDLSASRDNVLFVRFEDMKRDLPGVAGQVAGFLGLPPLSQAELDRVVQRCGFEYMRAHEGTFEMHPPHLLSVDAELFVRGSADRYRDVPEAVRRRIADWCTASLAESPFPLARFYPELGSRK